MIEELYFFGKSEVCSATRHLLNVGRCLGSNEFYSDTAFTYEAEKEHCWVDRLIEKITLGFEDLFESKRFSKEPHSRLVVYWAILPCVYECGAVLGRAQKAKVELLELMIPLRRPTILALHPKPVRHETSIVNSAKEAASLRLNEFKTKENREPVSASELITSTVDAKFFADITAKDIKKFSKLVVSRLFSLNEAYPYLRAFLLEGVGFGSTFPDLTESLFRNRYQSIDMAKWNKSKEETRQQGLLFPEEPKIISCEALETDILIHVALVAEDSYPQLLEPLDLVPYSYSFLTRDLTDDLPAGEYVKRFEERFPTTLEDWIGMYRCLLGEP